MDTRYPAAYLGYQVECLLLGYMTVHTPEHVVGNMLESNIQILAYIRFPGDYVKKVKGELVRIGIMKPDPFNSLYVSHTGNQFSDMVLSVKVDTIVSQFLLDNLKFLHTLGYKSLHLVQYILDCT